MLQAPSNPEALDRATFAELYRVSVRRIFNVVLRVVGNPHEAEDVTQEAYLQAYSSFSRFAGRASFYTWMYRVATNVALQYVRNRSRRLKLVVPLDGAHGVPPDVATTHDPEREQERRALYLALGSGIELLPPSQRDVLVLGAIQGQSYAQISRRLGTSTDVIKGRLHRARRNLKATLAAENEMPDRNLFKQAS